jgi:hypothetical protein
VIGISREHLGPLQACSWITRDRDTWLRALIGRRRWTRPQIAPLARHARHLAVGSPGALERFPIPTGASHVKATLSATGRSRLQMTIRSGSTPQDLLQETAEDYRANGRFLCREATLDPGAEEVAIGIAPVGGVTQPAGRIDAQLCCMFI